MRIIDWSESKWEDPFHDIAYFALLNGYQPKEEEDFFNAYLKRSLTSFERERYRLIRKEILLYFGIGLLDSVNEEAVCKQTSLKSWPYYISALFATPAVELNDQFFYEMSRRAFLESNSF